MCERSEFDLILMDNFMPKMMGVDCVKVLRGVTSITHEWLRSVPIGRGVIFFLIYG